MLAYSTVSQLGYMMMGLGVGAWVPAVFHIFTHAFFKCCLFLCAGSVSHTGSHHSFDMKKDMGGLFKKMPITAICWIVATLALCGVPFVSGFFSKDEIIDNAHNNGYTVFWIIGLGGAFLTTAYMTRATYLTFFGKARGAAAGEHAHVAGAGTEDDPLDVDALSPEPTDAHQPDVAFARALDTQAPEYVVEEAPPELAGAVATMRREEIAAQEVHAGHGDVLDPHMAHAMAATDGHGRRTVTTTGTRSTTPRASWWPATRRR